MGSACYSGRESDLPVSVGFPDAAQDFLLKFAVIAARENGTRRVTDPFIQPLLLQKCIEIEGGLS